MLQHRTGDDFYSVAVLRDYSSSSICLRVERNRRNQDLKVFIAAWKSELTKRVSNISRGSSCLRLMQQTKGVLVRSPKLYVYKVPRYTMRHFIMHCL